MRSSFLRYFKKSLPLVLLWLFLLQVGGLRLSAQSVPSVQQYQFRSQWIGSQVDQPPPGGNFPPIGGLGALVGSLQTPDQVQRDVEASLSGLNDSSPFTFQPSLGIGMQFSSQGSSSGSSGIQSSAYAAPAVVLGYNRDHGPWTISANYSTGYRYNFNPNYTGSGTGAAQNPISQTIMCHAVLEMSRYHVDMLGTASSGAGYDTTSASYNLQTAASATVGTKYVLSTYTTLSSDAGYSFQNSSGSTATPNNNTASTFGDFSASYSFTDKTQFSLSASAGSSSQGLQQGTAAVGNMPLTNSQNVSRTYGQALFSVGYTYSPKLIFNLGLGVRYVSSSMSSSLFTGLQPAWTGGFSYTPTEKTSMSLSSGLQASDVTPELNYTITWHPRQKTQLSLGISQSEQFANSLSGEYVVSRNITGTLSQQLFSSVNMSLSGGYASQNYVNLASQTIPGQSSSQLPSSYYFGSLSVSWRIREWASLVNNLTFNTGRAQGSSGGSNQPQYLYSISLNFSL